MANFAIMRAKKLKGMGSVASSLGHCFRERETLNADDARTPDNEHLQIGDQKIDNTDAAMGRLRDCLPEKRRKDAVLAVEYVMTASPGWWETASEERQQQFFRESVTWLMNKYGAENVVAASVHRDELSPHLSAFVVPRTPDGRLSAKEFIGNRTKMSQDQTDFAKCVSHLGLERGIEGSKAKHQRVKAHYAALQRANEQVPTIDRDELKPQKLKGQTVAEKVFGARETTDGVVQRLNAKMSQSFRPVADLAATSAQNARRAEEMAATARAQRDELDTARHKIKRLQKPWAGLTKDDHRALIEQANQLRKRREAERIAHEKRVREEHDAIVKRTWEDDLQGLEGRLEPEKRQKVREKPPERPQEARKADTPSEDATVRQSPSRGLRRRGMSR